MPHVSIHYAVKVVLCILASPLVLVYFVASAVRSRMGRGKQRQGIVLFSFSQVIWDDVWQRPQEHAWRSAVKHDVVYCAPVQLHNWFWNLGRRFRQVKTYQRGAGSLLVLSPLVFSGHFKSRFVHEVNCAIIAWHARLWMGRHTAVHCVANTPFALRPIQRLFYRDGQRSTSLRRLVYDVIDDFTAFDWSPDFGKTFDSDMLKMADAVLTGTHQLARALINSTFIPCGVNFTEFSTPAPAPADIAKLRKPVIGYFGTISERIDLDLIAEICEAYPHAAVVLIGPIHFQQAGLPHKPNLHYLGLKPHEQIPAYAQAFDVGLIPFRLTPATLQLHPVKTLEYLAAGIPVVSTALPDVEHFYSGIVDVAHSRHEFIELVGKRLDRVDPTRIAAGIERARRASWEAMTDRINASLLTESTGAGAAAEHEFRRPKSHSAEPV